MSISVVTRSDWSQWQNLFRQYIAFYNTSIPEQQYQNTFDRIIDTDGDLHAFVIREEDGTLSGLAHFLYHTSSWSDKPVCYLNGTLDTIRVKVFLTNRNRSFCESRYPRQRIWEEADRGVRQGRRRKRLLQVLLDHAARKCCGQEAL